MKTYLVTFDRIGRNHHVPPLTAAAASLGDLAGEIHKYARPHLMSRDVAVVCDEAKGSILCGFHSGGSFTVQEVAA